MTKHLIGEFVFYLFKKFKWEFSNSLEQRNKCKEENFIQKVNPKSVLNIWMYSYGEIFPFKPYKKTLKLYKRTDHLSEVKPCSGLKLLNRVSCTFDIPNFWIVYRVPLIFQTFGSCTVYL